MNAQHTILRACISIVLIAVIAQSTLAQGQTTFHFGPVGGAEYALIGFRTTDIGTWTITPEGYGYWFDENLEYKGGTPLATAMNFSSSGGVGYYPNQGNPNPFTGGDITNGEVLDYGMYRFTVSNGTYSHTFFMNLADSKINANWPQNSLYFVSISLLFDCRVSGGQILIDIYTSVAYDQNTDNCYLRSTLTSNNEEVKYTDLQTSTGLYAGAYVRDRDGFTISDGTIPLYANSVAVLDVNALVTANITVEANEALHIKEDYDPVSGFGSHTTLKFDKGIGLYVNPDGALAIENTTLTTSAFPLRYANRWGGIHINNASQILIGSSSVSFAEPGLSIANQSTVCMFDYCSIDSCFIGAEIENSSYANFGNSVFARNEIYGLAATQSSTPQFNYCIFNNNYKSGASSYAPGMYATNSSYVIASNCQFTYNRGHGIETSFNGHVNLDNCIIAGNYLSGLHLGVANRWYPMDEWNTLRNSKVFWNREGGIMLNNSNIRGWFNAGPIAVSDRGNITDIYKHGNNCIYENTDGNCLSVGDSAYWELGRDYKDGSGTIIYLGDLNVIRNPINGSQLVLDRQSSTGILEAFFYQNDWVNDYTHNFPSLSPTLPPPTWTYLPEITNTTYCNSAGGKVSAAMAIKIGSRLVSLYPDAERSLSDQIANASRNLEIEGAGLVKQLSIDSRCSSKGFILYSAYPNPFNPSTEISFSLPESQAVTLTVYNIFGAEVATIANGVYASGLHTVTFDATNRPSGIYMYVLRSGNIVLSNKMTLMK